MLCGYIPSFTEICLYGKKKREHCTWGQYFWGYTIQRLGAEVLRKWKSSITSPVSHSFSPNSWSYGLKSYASTQIHIQDTNLGKAAIIWVRWQAKLTSVPCLMDVYVKGKKNHTTSLKWTRDWSHCNHPIFYKEKKICRGLSLELGTGPILRPCPTWSPWTNYFSLCLCFLIAVETASSS